MTTLPTETEEYRKIIEKKEKLQKHLETRDREYKTATKNYLESLKKEVHTFQASNVKIEERNSQILTELNQIMDRYKLGIDNIRKSDGLLQEQKEGLNRYVLSNFGGITNKIRSSMASEGKRIDLILEEFNKPSQPPPPQQTMPVRRQQKEELPNNYQELYQNFAEYNNRNNPQRVEEIKKINPTYIDLVNARQPLPTKQEEHYQVASPFPLVDTYQPPPYVQALPPSYPGRDLPHRTAQEPERDEFLTLNNFQVSRKEGGYAQEDAGVNVRGSKGQPAQGLLVDAGQGQGGLLDAFKFRKGPTVNYQAEGRRLEDLTNPGNQMQYSGVFGQQRRSGNFMEDYSDYHEISLE